MTISETKKHILDNWNRFTTTELKVELDKYWKLVNKTENSDPIFDEAEELFNA